MKADCDRVVDVQESQRVAPPQTEEPDVDRNIVTAWIDTCCNEGDLFQASTETLLQSLNNYLRETGISKSFTRQRLGRVLSRLKKYPPSRNRFGRRCWKYLRPKE